MAACRVEHDPAASRPATRRRTARRHQAPTAYTPGSYRKNAKVKDAGARVEDQLIRLLTGRKVRIDAWRLPGVKIKRTNGAFYHPDAAGWMPELAGLAVERTPNVRDPRPDYNVLFEFKGQTGSGSAKEKIPTAIVDMASACDELGVLGAFILHTPALTREQVTAYKQLGAMHSVVVLEDTETTYERLLAEFTRVGKERRRLMRRIGPRGGYTATKRPPIYETGLAARSALRRVSSTGVVRYGLRDLVTA